MNKYIITISNVGKPPIGDLDEAAKNLIGNAINLTITNDSTNSSKVPLLDEHSGKQAEEKHDSLAIFFILFIIVLAILLVHLLIKFQVRFMPESLAIVLLGGFIGFILSQTRWDWSEVEQFNPSIFFLVLLPPIIFESGYNLHKGNFFANIVPILLFAVVGTAISSFIMGFFLYIFGQLGIAYSLSAVESFAFGSMISAVDPVITLAIFQALKVEVQLYMLAFGESMLNDAVAIVLATTAQELSSPSIAAMSSLETLKFAFDRFFVMFFASAALGVAIGLVSALLFKHIDLRRTPSLELALLLMFAYLPYGFAESFSLSGIMAILFCAIIMSQYTHLNISPITQITFQQTFRTISFVAETCTFAYLGLALFTIELILYKILLFVSRAASVFPLSSLVNRFSKTKISMKNQIIMWFSGMRGAVALALALHMEVETPETKRVILTSTLFMILFTIVFMGGSALPLIKILSDIFPEEPNPSTFKQQQRRRRRTRGNKANGGVNGTTTTGSGIKSSSPPFGAKQRHNSPVILSKTQEMVIFDSEQFTDEVENGDNENKRPKSSVMPERKNFFVALNDNFIRPFFVRKFTKQEKLENNKKLRHIAFKAMNHDGVTGDGVGGGASSSGPAIGTSSDEEVFFQSSSTLNAPNSCQIEDYLSFSILPPAFLLAF
ncbi:Sodium/hydrogen exchanger [Meloidogyne graminicola]|uniref:Sodium/hydrogen exchanger n=1 Tax=Meloidogyne graminicola TaxID=189291 RepID=A0A8S9ZNL4_9BILA|nr:Sodium/hydrogen exchanger [Meloidogyne graminicola]